MSALKFDNNSHGQANKFQTEKGKMPPNYISISNIQRPHLRGNKINYYEVQKLMSNFIISLSINHLISFQFIILSSNAHLNQTLSMSTSF